MDERKIILVLIFLGLFVTAYAFRDNTIIQQITNFDWGSIINVPAGFADNIDNTGSSCDNNAACTLPIVDGNDFYNGINVEQALQDAGSDINSIKNFFNGTFENAFDALVTSDGATVTMSLEKKGGGNLIMNFSGKKTSLDCTPACTIELTTGSDTSPQINAIYIPASTMVLTKSTSGFPTDEQHIRVGYFHVPSAGFVQTHFGAYINQNWNNYKSNGDYQGFLANLTERLRYLGAVYFSGVAGNGTDGYLTPTASNVAFASTSGIVYQMHNHTIPAYDTVDGNILLVKNWSGDAYHDTNQLFDITADSAGVTITNNKYFNLVFWATANKTGQFSPMMVNLPGGFYNTQNDAENDVSSYDDFTIPREFQTESSTGFLIAKVTIQMGTTWTVTQTVDLRGTTPATAGGGATGITSEFVDNVFRVVDESDGTKEMAFDVGSLVTTGNTRTITIPDRDLDLDSPDFNGITDLNLVEASCDVMASAEGGLYCGTNGAGGDVNSTDINATNLWTQNMLCIDDDCIDEWLDVNANGLGGSHTHDLNLMTPENYILLDVRFDNLGEVDGEDGEFGTLTTGTLKGIWHFEEGTGTTPDDDSGNDHDFTFGAGAAAPAWIADGKYGSAISYDGGDYLTKADDVDFDIAAANSFSVGFWMKSANTADAGNDVLMTKESKDAPYAGWVIRSSGSDKAQFYIIDTPAGNLPMITGDTDIYDQEWHFVVAVRDVDEDKIYLYVDGSSDATPVTDTTTGTMANDQPLLIGTSAWLASFFTGTIDEPFLLKGIALDVNEVAMLYENRWWGQTFMDGKQGQAYYAFDGSSLSYETEGDILKDQGTISMWVNNTWIAEDGTNHSYFDMARSGNFTDRLILYKHSSNALRMVIFDADEDATDFTLIDHAVNSTNFVKGTWHHIVTTWDASTDNISLQLFLNGALVNETETITGAGAKLLSLPAIMHIGRDAPSQANEAKSKTNNFKIYSRPLSAAEVAQLYNEELWTTTTGAAGTDINGTDTTHSGIWDLSNLSCTEVETDSEGRLICGIDDNGGGVDETLDLNITAANNFKAKDHDWSGDNNYIGDVNVVNESVSGDLIPVDDLISWIGRATARFNAYLYDAIIGNNLTVLGQANIVDLNVENDATFSGTTITTDLNDLGTPTFNTDANTVTIKAWIKDEDFEDISDWATGGTGTYTVEESPAGQLHLICGNAGGTDSTANASISDLAVNLQTLTAEFEIKFDQLAGGYDGTAATGDFIQFRYYSGIYQHIISMTSDSVWYYAASNAHIKQFDTPFDNVSWYTIRIVIEGSSFTMFAKDDDGTWAYLGAGKNPDPYAVFSGKVQWFLVNYPTNPAETEVHINDLKITPGAAYP